MTAACRRGYHGQCRYRDRTWILRHAVGLGVVMSGNFYPRPGAEFPCECECHTEPTPVSVPSENAAHIDCSGAPE